MSSGFVRKAVAFTSFVFGIAVLFIALWTFGSLLYWKWRVCTDKNKLIQSDHSTTTNIPLTSNITERTYEELPTFFEGVVLGCDVAALSGALIQVFVSSVALFSSEKNGQRHLKYFLAFHFITLIILGGTLILPLSYDREQDKFHTMTSFTTEIKHRLSTFSLENIDIGSYVMEDLHLYYLALSSDFVVVIIAIIVASMLIRHSMIVRHEAELFYDYDRYV